MDFKKNIRLLLIFLIIFITFSCTAFIEMQDQKEAYSNNEVIVKQNDSYNTKDYIGQAVDNNVKADFSSFTGMRTILSFSSTKDIEIDINYKSEIVSGDFRLVLITGDNEVIDILKKSRHNNKNAVESEEGVKTIKIPKGTNRIKIAGIKSKKDKNSLF